MNSACWPARSVTTDGGWVGGPERFTESPFIIVIGTDEPEELKRARTG